MEPIIPPMWIYLIHLASTLRFMAIYTLCASIMILIFIYAGAIELIRDSNEKLVEDFRYNCGCVFTYTHTNPRSGYVVCNDCSIIHYTRQYLNR